MSKLRDRSQRRALERSLRKLAADREELFRISVGGSPERPIRVVASPVVDIRASSTPCPLCEGQLRLNEHASQTVEGKSLRVARMICVRCHIEREIWFEIAPDLPN